MEPAGGIQDHLRQRSYITHKLGEKEGYFYFLPVFLIVSNIHKRYNRQMALNYRSKNEIMIMDDG